MTDPDDKEKVVAVAVTVPPSPNPKAFEVGLCAMISAAGVAGALPKVWESGKGKQRLDALGAVMGKAHKKHAAEQHLYIHMLAANVEYQRKGYGRKMLAFLTSIGDAFACPVYLETSGDGLEKFYSGADFQTVEKVQIKDDKGFPGDVMDMTIMVRPGKKDV